MAYAQAMAKGFRAVWRDTDGRKHTSPAPYFTTEAAARAYAREQEGLSRGARPGQRLTYGQWRVRWALTRGIEDSTAGPERSYMNRWIAPRWDDCWVDEAGITRPMVRLWLEDLQDAGLGNGTIARIHGVFRKSLQDACDIDPPLIRSNPCVGVKVPKAPRSIGQAYTYTEFEAIIAKMPAHYRPTYLGMGLTGMRPSEVIGLHWARVHESPRSILVREVLSAGHIKPVPKDDDIRTVRIPQTLLRELRRPANWREPCGMRHVDKDGREEDCPGQLVFRGPHGGVLDPRNLRDRVWQPAVAAAGAPKGRQYDLRHSWTTWALMGGTDIHEVAALLGHSTTWVTERYRHVIPGFGANALDAIDRLGAATDLNQLKNLRDRRAGD